MRTRRALPPGLGGHPFAVRDALAAGAPRKRLRAKDLNAHYWGTRATPTAALSLHDRCKVLQTRLPADALFSHSTAALLLNAPLPWVHEQDTNVHVSVPSPHRALTASGIVGHKMQLTDADLSAVRSVRTTAPARTWCDLATVLNLHDLVAVGDFLIHWRRPLASLGDLENAVATYPGRKGRTVLRRSLALLNDRAESRPESILRVIFVLGGLPLPQVNRDVVEAEGKVFARLDLRYAREKVAIEYQGDYHRSNRAQWRKDMSRRRRLEAKGWYVIEINADDLRDPEELVAMIRSVLLGRQIA